MRSRAGSRDWSGWVSAMAPTRPSSMPSSPSSAIPSCSASTSWMNRTTRGSGIRYVQQTACGPSRIEIHANVPGARAFIVLMNFGSTKSPTYANTYNPGNSHIDLYGLDPYPCRSELGGCDYGRITVAVAAAEAAGIPVGSIVPVYQAFGGGSWSDDGGGYYLLPTPSEEQQILATWAALVPTPVFDYAYSWGTQNSDQALESSTDLQAVFAAHNQ